MAQTLVQVRRRGRGRGTRVLAHMSGIPRLGCCRHWVSIEARASRLVPDADVVLLPAAQFVARLPPASPGSAAEALRSRLGARLSAPALGEWIRDFTEALAANATRQAPTLAEEPQITLATADSPDGPVWDPQEQEQLQAELEGAVERLLASQPQLLAQDSAVLVARLRGLAGLLQLQLLRRPPGGSGPGGGGGPTALDLALQRPALLLADLPTLERRLAALQAALGLPDRAAAVAAAVQQPVWLYMEPPPPPV